MTDIEIVRKCAERMGLQEFKSGDDMQFCTVLVKDEITKREKRIAYWPLTDDAQAMAMIDHLGLSLKRDPYTLFWCATYTMKDGNRIEGGHDDIRRAICLCVANLQEKS